LVYDRKKTISRLMIKVFFFDLIIWTYLTYLFCYKLLNVFSGYRAIGRANNISHRNLTGFGIRRSNLELSPNKYRWVNIISFIVWLWCVNAHNEYKFCMKIWLTGSHQHQKFQGEKLVNLQVQLVPPNNENVYANIMI
jgi:hypothetical protein